jgi:hypothetical protein
MASHFHEGRWRDCYEASAMELSSYCQARGRYELAEELLAIGTEWYEREVIKKSHPGDINDYGKPLAQILEEYRQRLAEFPLLWVTRSRLLGSLNGLVDGIDRDKLKTVVKHEGATAFGVICNQLARGGWIRQEKTGKKYTIYPESTAPASDELFVSKEFPTPEGNDRPVVTIYDPAASHEIPAGYELVESDPIVPRPMTPELQEILDDARQAGFLVLENHTNDGFLIRPYFEHELDENFILYPVPKPCGTPLVRKTDDRELPRGLTILPDHTARRMDVKPWLAEDIVDYGVMRAVLGLEPRPANQPEQPTQ